MVAISFKVLCDRVGERMSCLDAGEGQPLCFCSLSVHIG